MVAEPFRGGVPAEPRAPLGRGVFACLLVGTIALAVGLRVAFWWMQARSGAVQPGDSLEYYQGAVSLLTGAGYLTGLKWIRPPLYPLALAATFAVTGIDLVRAMLVQAVVSGVGVLAFAALGSALFRRRDVALLSALIAALFIPFAAYSSVLFAEAIFIMLMSAFFALVLIPIDRASRSVSASGESRFRPRWSILAGVTLGLAILTRAVALFFLPLVVIGTLADHWISPRAGRGSRLRPVLAHGSLTVLVAALTVAPWTVRNAVVFQRFVPVETNGGISFWYGTVANDRALAQGEEVLAQTPNLADKQRIAMDFAFQDIARDPLQYVARVRYKVVSLWQLGSRNYAAGGIVSFDPDGHSLGLTPGELPLLLSLLGDAQYVALVLLGIWGYCYAPRSSRSVLLLLWVIFGTAMSGLTTAHPRLRLPLLVAFVPYAAAALLAVSRAAGRLRWPSIRPGVVPTLLSVAFLLLIFTQHYARFARAQAIVWLGDRSDPAVYHRAYAVNPANPLWLMAAADQEAREQDWARAEASYARAAEQEPRSLYAQVRLMQMALRQGDAPGAARALAVLRSMGRDNNDLLRWAWWRVDTPPRGTLSPASAQAIGHIAGFTPTEQGSDERWTQATARLRLQPRQTCRRLVLELRGRGNDQRVEVETPGRTVTLAVSPARAVYQVPLAPSACDQDRPFEVTLRTATAVRDVGRQPWPVGVAVSGVNLE